MSLAIYFRPAAWAEYAEAIAWYERARTGLGGAFEREVEALVAQAAASPHRYPVADRDVHEAALTRFPYCVYYRVREDKLIVLAVYHQSRNPRGWQQRFSEQ